MKVNYETKVLLTLPHDNKSESANARIDDTAMDGLSSSLAVTTFSVAAVTLAQQKSDTTIGEDTLLHGETLLVVSTSDSDNVTLKQK